MEQTDGRSNWRDIFFTSNDGLTLYARHYPARSGKLRPLLCLPGLTRNSLDFHSLATYLANHPGSPRDVYCLDFRGRGRSDYDPEEQNYTPFIELIDTLDFMTLAGLHKTAILGTSRGGIVTMLMGAVRPASMGPVILNDIGPVLDKTGLTRIRGYVGRTPLPYDWEEATHMMRSMNERSFGNLSDEDWVAIAHQCFSEDENGRPVPSYDKKLAAGLEAIDLTKDLPAMWEQFQSLSRNPLMVIRGQNSDILSADTVTGMAKLHPRMEQLVVEKQGHAPLLRDEATQSAVSVFLSRCDVGLQAVSSDGHSNFATALRA